MDALPSCVMSIICKYLNIAEIKVVANVNQIWKNEVERVLFCLRIIPTCAILGVDKKYRPFIIGKSIFYNNWENGLCFVFRGHQYSRVIDARAIVPLGNSPQVEYIGMQNLFRLTDKFCYIANISEFSLFWTDANEPLIRLQRPSTSQYLMFPKLKNTRMQWFDCTLLSDTVMFEKENYISHPHEKLKCLLIFSMDNNSDVNRLLNILLPENQKELVAGAGSIITDKKICRSNVNKVQCVLILEKLNVNSKFDAHSFRIKGRNLSDEEIDNQLEKFKNAIRLRKHTIGVIIVCNCPTDLTNFVLLKFSRKFQKINLLGMETHKDINWNNRNIIDVEEIDNINEIGGDRSERLPSIQIVLWTWDVELEEEDIED